MCSYSYTAPAAVGDPVVFCLPRESFISAASQHLRVVYLRVAWQFPSDYKMLCSRKYISVEAASPASDGWGGEMEIL